MLIYLWSMLASMLCWWPSMINAGWLVPGECAKVSNISVCHVNVMTHLAVSRLWLLYPIWGWIRLLHFLWLVWTTQVLCIAVISVGRNSMCCYSLVQLFKLFIWNRSLLWAVMKPCWPSAHSFLDGVCHLSACPIMPKLPGCSCAEAQNPWSRGPRMEVHCTPCPMVGSMVGKVGEEHLELIEEICWQKVPYQNWTGDCPLGNWRHAEFQATDLRGGWPRCRASTDPITLLVGRPLFSKAPVSPDVPDTSSDDLRLRLNYRKKLLEKFWYCWMKEYLRTLPPCGGQRSVGWCGSHSRWGIPALSVATWDHSAGLSWPWWAHSVCPGEDSQRCSGTSHSTHPSTGNLWSHQGLPPQWFSVSKFTYTRRGPIWHSCQFHKHAWHSWCWHKYIRCQYIYKCR